MSDIKCVVCGSPIASNTGRGRPRRYCSDACRKAGTRFTASIPSEMTSADRWMRWRYVPRGDGRTKQPMRPDGSPASSTHRRTWCDFDTANSSHTGDGLGFALGDGFACVDLDHCYTQQHHLEPWAKMLLAPVRGKTYVELSPSGEGLHIFGTCAERSGIKVRGIANAEAYSRDRYMTVTGRTWRDSPAKLADLTFLFDLLERLR